MRLASGTGAGSGVGKSGMMITSGSSAESDSGSEVSGMTIISGGAHDRFALAGATDICCLFLLREKLKEKNIHVQVMDGERGNEYRKQLLPAYKSNRNAFVPLSKSHRRETWKGNDADLREAFPRIKSFLKSCGIPVVSLEDAEADDVVASLTEQAVCKGFRVTIASPDKDFKQLLCENVQLVVPLTGLHRWSFYTEKLYTEQHGCNPETELSLRCLLGDKVDCIPGLAEFAPGFGRKTALKLLKKHGSIERLLEEASTRTVGKPFVQDALTQHAPALWKNLEVLRLRRDLPVCLVEEWCVYRKSTNDEKAFSELEKHLKALRDQRVQMDGARTKYVAKRLVVGKISES
ncbi:hypothetical protein L7F22_053291 [Adiantum nelumboides]|nr:hypothetical protein [Adiantum nelumboides]